MIDLSRCRNIFAVGAGLGLAVSIFNFAFALAFGPFPRWLVTEHIPMGWGFMEENDALIAGILAEARRGRVESSRPFSVYIGKSTARHDIDPEILAALDGTNGRYLCLWGQGEGMHDLDLLARPLLASDLRPHLALICIHPAFLAGRASERLENPLDPFPPPADGPWRGLAGLVDRYNVIRGKAVTSYMNHAIRTVLYEARIRLFDHLRLNRDAFSQPERAPWRPRYPEVAPPRDPEDQIRLRVQACARLGWFEREQYDKYHRSLSETLVGVIRGFRSRGTGVIVVLMPETAEIRGLVPPEAQRYLVEDLTNAFAGVPPELFDFQRSMPDSMFVDHIHLNETGRREFSKLLARAIKDHQERERGPDRSCRPADEVASTYECLPAGASASGASAPAVAARSDAAPPASPGR